MGATIYSTPTEVGAMPDFGDFRTEGGGFDTQAYFDAVAEFEKRVQEWARENGNGDVRGEIIRFGVADGKASYVVYTTKPLALIDVGDEYRIDAIFARGLRVADVRKRVAAHKRMDELFGRNKIP